MSEIIESWPVEQIGHLMAMNYRYEPRDPRVWTEISAGMPKDRLLSHDIIVDHYFSLSFTFAEEAYFRWWLKNRVDTGRAWFLLPLHSGAGMNDSEAKFRKVSDSKRVGLRYQIDCHVITRKKPAEELTEAEVLALLEFGTTELQTYSQELNAIVNEDW